MRIAVISDTHFGDHMCRLACRDEKNNCVIKGPKYDELVKALTLNEEDQPYPSPLDYLVLSGDIFDFTISSYQEAFETGQAFFKWIKSDNIAKEIIYIAGNHDFDIWHTVEYEVNVINRIRDRGDIPNLFRMSVPGIIDDRNCAGKLLLPGVSARSTTGPRYAGLFLDSITLPEEKTAFNFVYPNLYLLTPAGENILVTHGHYLDSAWSFLGETVQKLEPSVLKINTVKEMVSYNFPVTQFLSSGIGQAGAFSDMADIVLHEVKDKDITRVKRYLDVFDHEIKENIREATKGLAEAVALVLEDRLYDIVKNIITRKLLSVNTLRYSKDFMQNEKTRDRFTRFYNACCGEIDNLNETGMNLPYPRTMIFGHTHQPVPWDSIYAPKIQLDKLSGKILSMYNSGGWLDMGGSFVGAEVFHYETTEGFRSVSIR